MADDPDSLAGQLARPKWMDPLVALKSQTGAPQARAYNPTLFEQGEQGLKGLIGSENLAQIQKITNLLLGDPQVAQRHARAPGMEGFMGGVETAMALPLPIEAPAEMALKGAGRAGDAALAKMVMRAPKGAEAAMRVPDAAMSHPRMVEGYNPEAIKLGQTDRIAAADARHHLDAPALKSMEADFRKELDRLGLHDVDVQATTHAQMTNLTGSADAGGYFDTSFARPLIRVAMHDVGSPRSIFNHETAHALEHVGVVKPGEKDAVLAYAQRDPELAEWVKHNYDPKNPENIKSELFAESYSRWVEGRSNPPTPVKAIFQRVKNFFEAMGNTFKGRGFRSADDVFKSMHEGRMGARERAGSTLGEGGAGGNEIFIGKKGAEQIARTPEADRHPELRAMLPVSMAERMERDGVDPEKIRQTTGWWRDPNDGQFKYEIDDSKLRMRDSNERYSEAVNRGKSGGSADMSAADNLFDHPALFQAYPELGKFTAFDRALSGTLGSFDPAGKVIRVEPDAGKLNTAAHELQHGVQHFEGWPRGGNPEMAGKYLNPEQLQAYKADRVAEAANAFDRAKEAHQAVKQMFNLPEMREYAAALASGNRPRAATTDAVYAFIDNHPTQRMELREARKKLETDLRTKQGLSADQALSDVADEYGMKSITANFASAKVHNSTAEDLALYADKTQRNKWYNQLAGEYEARDAGARQALTPEERKALPPRSDEHISKKNLLFRNGPAGEVAASGATFSKPGRSLSQKVGDVVKKATESKAEKQHRTLLETVPGYKTMAQHLTPTERANVRAQSAQKLVSIFNKLPTADEMASVAWSGRAKRGWYKNSAKALVEVFGAHDADRFAALLAALSPQTSVESNTVNALKIWNSWIKAGRPSDKAAILDIMAKNVQGSGTEKSVLDAWRNNTYTALSEGDPRSFELSGPKVNSFSRNLRDQVHEVTNDAWMANYGGVDQTLFAKQGNIEGGKGLGYRAMSARARQAASVLSKRTGETWTPAEIQETVWSWAKTLYEARRGTGMTVDTRAILAAGGLTHEAIGSTPDFEKLFIEGVYRKILEEGGYGDQLKAVERSVADRVGTDGNARPRGDATSPEGAGIAPDAVGKHLDKAAGRLEKLYLKRAAEKRKTLIANAKAKGMSKAEIDRRLAKLMAKDKGADDPRDAEVR